MKHIKNIAIVGAGISGLSAAMTLSRKSNTQVTVFDSLGRPGGNLQTIYQDGFLIEQSADMFVTDPAAGVEICKQIGFEEELIEPFEENRFSSIVRNGELVRTPAGFSLLAPNQIRSVLNSSLLSTTGKFRFLLEYFKRPTKDCQDVSLKAFTIRHFGREVFERMVQPLVAGIYSADADRLSIKATLNRFMEMEQRHGSLIKAARRQNRRKPAEQQSSGARYGMFVTPRLGFESLVNALVDAIPSVDFRMNREIDRIGRCSNGWTLGSGNKAEVFDGIILSTSARVSSNLVTELEPSLANSLKRIPFGSMTVVTITCKDSNFNQLPKGFGFVVPEIENRKIIACSYSSNKFPGRAQRGNHLMRAFIGGKFMATAKPMNDETLQQTVATELNELIGFRSSPDVGYQVVRWHDCMPQYEVGHLERVEEIHGLMGKQHGLELAGNSYSGVGIPACIQSGIDSANRIMLR